MSNKEYLVNLRQDAREKLNTIKLKEGSEVSICWLVGNQLGISGPTVKNYITRKNIADGFIALAIYRAFKNLGYCKRSTH